MEDWTLQAARDFGVPLSRRPLDLQREPGLIETGGHVLWRSALRCYLSTYHRLRILHADRIPAEPPFVIVANHASHLDALAISAALPLRLCDRVFPIAAGDVFFQTPAIGWLAVGLINALPMWRKNTGAHAMQTLRAKLTEQACGYILFPEGGRTRDGTVRPFKSGLGMLVAGTNVPVIPCAIEGTFAALPAGRIVPRPVRLSLTFGPALRFAELTNDRPGWERIALAAQHSVQEVTPGRAPVA